MPKNNVVKIHGDFNDSFKLPNQGLKTYFGKVVKGNSLIYDTPFARGESTQELLGNWKKELESVRQQWPSLFDFEMDLAEKVGPLSVQKPLKDRMSDIDSYYEGILLPSKPVLHSAVAAVCGEWDRAKGMNVRSQRKTVELMKKSTNSGSPYFTKRRNVVDETVLCHLMMDNGDVWQTIGTDANYTSGSFWEAPAVLGWRGQEGGPSAADVKQRVVWMFPFSVNICELQVYQPLIEAAQRFDIVPAWVGMDEVDKRITQLFDSKADSDLVVCTDFTKFDQHFNSSLQNVSREIIESILSTEVRSKTWLLDVFPIKYMIPLCYDYGKIRFGKHGMGSGSGGTNADETLAHRALQFEAAILNNQRLNPNSQCLGDDGILSYPGITVEDVVKAYSSHGLLMNESKQYASTHDCVYLRRWHDVEYRVNGICAGVYSTCRALGRLRYLERYYDPEIWGPKMVALRQLSIIENCKYHPLFEKFIEFCMKRDKFRLGIDIPGFLDNIEDEAKIAIDYMPDFLGYTKSLSKEAHSSGAYGISQWAVVKYLKSKA